MGFILASAVVPLKIKQKNLYTHRLLCISSEKNIKHMEGSEKVAKLTSECTARTDAKRKELGENPSSEEMMANMQEIQSIENEFSILIENARNAMKSVEDRLARFQEIVETQLEVITKEVEQWKELSNAEAEKCGYFNN